jgi:type III secretion system TyeA family effector delivery regulator
MPDEYSAHDLMKELLDMTTQRWIDPDRFIQMLAKIGVRKSDMRIYFLTQLRERVRLIPLKLYPVADTREKILDALQQAMDIEIAREEAT